MIIQTRGMEGLNNVRLLWTTSTDITMTREVAVLTEHHNRNTGDLWSLEYQSSTPSRHSGRESRMIHNCSPRLSRDNHRAGRREDRADYRKSAAQSLNRI